MLMVILVRKLRILVLWLVEVCVVSSCGCLLMKDVVIWFVWKFGLFRIVCRNGIFVDILWIWNFVIVWCVWFIVVGRLWF